MGLFRVRQSRVWIVCVYFCVLWLSDAQAQSSAQLSGSVLDATGLPLVGATVTLRGAVSKATQTNSEGQFDFQGLAGGEYE